MDRLGSSIGRLFGVSWKSRGVEDDVNEENVIHRITREEYDEPIQDAYVQSVARLSYAELDDKYNPGIQVRHCQMEV
ncbi:unnamed protein product [Litomosoides sigmodontis]|uniref:Uncharacterized protein n=1 Tax=Litomosoides sigmodontis TaxID=42156 RepID=A0A3P6VDH1_LITSI|nr:unnamed protein product [Litomosoides sigmodontis]